MALFYNIYFYFIDTSGDYTMLHSEVLLVLNIKYTWSLQIHKLLVFIPSRYPGLVLFLENKLIL